MGSVGPVQFQTVPCSSFYLYSRSVGPLQCFVIVNYRVLTCCTCHFLSSSLFFILASSVCKYLRCLISAPTQGGEIGHLFRLPCSVVLWGGRNTANKCHWRVWGVLAVYRPRWVCSSSWCVPSGSTLLRLQGALQEHHPKWGLRFMHFPGLSHSGSASRVIHKGTDSAVHVFCALPRSKQLSRAGSWQEHCPRWAMCLNHLPSPSCSVPRCAVRALSQVSRVAPLGS